MKIIEIGGYPPPNTGWSVRIKFLKEGFIEQGDDCRVLNIGRNRKIKSPDYIDVQNSIDFLKKLVRYRIRGYYLHIHLNGQAVKGPILALLAQLISIFSGDRAALTFHGGIEQLYFPRRNAGKMFLVLYINFLISKMIICNNSDVKNEILKYGPMIKESKVNSIPAFSIQYLKYRKVSLTNKIKSFMGGKKHIILCYIVLRNGFFVDTFVNFLKQCDDSVGVIISGINEPEDEEVSGYYEKMKELESKGLILVIEDLDHDVFMTLLNKCTLYLRTPVSDGVASSVLEALSQGVPVVASENGRRPEGVLTYHAQSVEDLSATVKHVLENYKKIKEKLKKPEIEDTIKIETIHLKRVFKN